MTTFVVPPLDKVPMPTLGPQVCDFIEAYLVHGPGDLLGQPARIDGEKRALLYRMYEVYPAGHNQAGRRRFRRVAISLRKGSAKTEFAAWIAACELHRDGPVRCDGFNADGEPVGAPVTDPYIPMVAYTEEQSEDLAYGALKAILERSSLADEFDIGLERIMRISHEGRAEGKAVPLATAPDSRDGARTTFEHFDETHRFTASRLKAAHRTMLANLPKRFAADPWALETTTAPAPGEGSVAESTMEYAKAISEGKQTDRQLFFFHRQAGDEQPIDLATREEIRAAVIEASGPIAEWSDINGIVDQWDDPTADRAYLERVWLNRLVQSSAAAFDSEQWRRLAQPNRSIPADGTLITLGFDGARYSDSTALVATEVTSGFQWPIGIWEKPPVASDLWEVSEEEVNEAVSGAFRRWRVWRMYADPPFWETQVARWSANHEQKVIAWRTNKWSQVAYAIRGFANAITAGEITHNGDPVLTRHIGNACRHDLTLRDDQQRVLWVIQKERSDSLRKIDGAMAALLSWQARIDAIASGVNVESVYSRRGVLAF